MHAARALHVAIDQNNFSCKAGAAPDNAQNIHMRMAVLRGGVRVCAAHRCSTTQLIVYTAMQHRNTIVAYPK